MRVEKTSEAVTTLEHLNITVPDITVALKFLALIAPDFSVRKDAMSERGYRWVHVGNETCYFALQEPHPGSTAEAPRQSYTNHGVNHIGIIIEDASATESKLLARGYKPNGPMVIESYRKRIYFYDDTGFEWEMVEYLSDSPADKYLYE